MKESLLKLAELLAENEEFAKKFSLLKSVDEQYDFAQKSVSGYTKEEFKNFLDEIERSYELISPEDMEKVSGGVNVRTKVAAMAMLALSAVGSAVTMLTSASGRENEEIAGSPGVSMQDQVGTRTGEPKVEDNRNNKDRFSNLNNNRSNKDRVSSLTNKGVLRNLERLVVPGAGYENGDEYATESTFEVGRIPEELRRFDSDPGSLENMQLGDHINNNSSEECGWVKVGNILYKVLVIGDSCVVLDICPFSYDARNATTIKIPENIAGKRVLDVQGVCGVNVIPGSRNISRVNNRTYFDEKFPNINSLIFPSRVVEFNNPSGIPVRDRQVNVITGREATVISPN